MIIDIDLADKIRREMLGVGANPWRCESDIFRYHFLRAADRANFAMRGTIDDKVNEIIDQASNEAREEGYEDGLHEGELTERQLILDLCDDCATVADLVAKIKGYS